MSFRNEYAQAAYRAMKIGKLPIVSIRDVLSISLEEAHARLVPLFDGMQLLPTKYGLIRPKWLDSANEMRKVWISGGNTKLAKAVSGLAMDVKIWGLSLVPALVSGFNLCAFKSKECETACIHNTGQLRFSYSQDMRTKKTQAFFRDPVAWLRMLVGSILAIGHKANRAGIIAGIRLNVLSDIPWEIVAPWLFDMIADFSIIAYDYTKVPGRVVPKNYHLTFSHTGHNLAHVDHEIARGLDIATVFGIPSKLADLDLLPKSWRDLEVVNADKHDFRPADRILSGSDRPICSGLTVKTAANVDMNSLGAFVVPVAASPRSYLPIV